MSLVEYACNNQIATLSLNRPDRLNAFSDELVRHLADGQGRITFGACANAIKGHVPKSP